MLLYTWQFAESLSVALVNFQKICVSQPFDSTTRRQGLAFVPRLRRAPFGAERSTEPFGLPSALSGAEWVETGLESY